MSWISVPLNVAWGSFCMHVWGWWGLIPGLIGAFFFACALCWLDEQ